MRQQGGMSYIEGQLYVHDAEALNQRLKEMARGRV
jgi:hypothetical protein